MPSQKERGKLLSSSLILELLHLSHSRLLHVPTEVRLFFVSRPVKVEPKERGKLLSSSLILELLHLSHSRLLHVPTEVRIFFVSRLPHCDSSPFRESYAAILHLFATLPRFIQWLCQTVFSNSTEIQKIIQSYVSFNEKFILADMDYNNLCYIIFKYGGYWTGVKGQSRMKYDKYHADFSIVKICEDSAPPLLTSDYNTRVVLSLEKYAYTMKVTEKCDIYSYGVLLLELLTGRTLVQPLEQGGDLATWVRNYIKDHSLNSGVLDLLKKNWKEEKKNKKFMHCRPKKKPGVRRGEQDKAANSLEKSP
ncbi:hypothetical protein IEQ34_004109 [Dendrobium chrysotoxum]|uniref:Serine-threonine/tyrosine-protein kinase catalytic domain-containing protein n=1 Tax=Dendrobium chrysotoxum TaxID=161865 RepID=A0AAV7HD64_DENCH|nr:hypothetical protein IEQ34_014417 [Dendrobium chrysotoxum]KAH0466871.1 hypothetical protein IEQ34_004109 [Dendrobium chrysotoxum]